MRFAFLIFVALVLAPLVPAIPAGDTKSVVQALEQRYRHASTLKAIFLERYMDGNGGVTSESGTVYFSRPGRMRWEYESPEQKLFLVDGANAWFYVPADHTASRAKMKESSDWRTPLALLAGKANLSELCRDIQLVAPSAPNTKKDEEPLSADDRILRCAPRGENNTPGAPQQDVLLETDSEAHLVRVLIREPGDVTTEFRFGNWQENIAIPEEKFHFQPPPGVAIVDEQSLAGAIH
jgi:outer membrane lipoprotein carrier protein